MRRTGTRTERGKKVTERELYRHWVLHFSKAYDLLTDRAELGLCESDLTVEDPRTLPLGAGAQRGAKRHHEQLEIWTRFEEHVILAWFEQYELARSEHGNAIADAKLGYAFHDKVDLWLLVKMARAPIRGLMAPNLRGAPGQHWKGLKQSARHQKTILPRRAVHFKPTTWRVESPSYRADRTKRIRLTIWSASSGNK
jgi:hypothetical protein